MNASSPQPDAPEAALRQAGQLGRRHGRAAVYWQIGDSGTPAALEFYRDLLRGIASADPAITGLYEVPDLTGRWEYERGNLATDLGLAAGDPALDQAAAEYLAAAREEFWLEAARLARRLTPAIGPAAGYAEDDLARDLGIDPRDRALPRAVSADADAFTGSFWQETERAAGDHSG